MLSVFSTPALRCHALSMLRNSDTLKFPEYVWGNCVKAFHDLTCKHGPAWNLKKRKKAFLVRGRSVLLPK